MQTVVLPVKREFSWSGGRASYQASAQKGRKVVVNMGCIVDDIS